LLFFITYSRCKDIRKTLKMFYGQGDLCRPFVKAINTRNQPAFTR